MKNKELVIIGAFVLLLAILLSAADAMKPKPIDWNPTFSARDKIPFGLYVLDAEAPTLFAGDSIKKFWKTPYEFFDARYSFKTKEYSVKGSFIEITNRNTLDTHSTEELLYFASHGNTVFLSMKDFPYHLLDTLNVGIDYPNFIEKAVQVSLAKDQRTRYEIQNGWGGGYFNLADNPDAKALGYQTAGLDDRPNFIEVPYGNGRFVLHTEPMAFTNYYLLGEGNFDTYAQGVLSAIPNGTIYWRNEYANSHYFENPGSKLRFILSQPALKWAWRLGLWGLLFFIIANGRRRQRVVPQIEPVTNTTIDFAKTIGNLYCQEADHHTIAEKKIIYFLEHIRTVYLIDTALLNDDFIEKLQLKTGKPKEDIRLATELILKHRRNASTTSKELVAINHAIEKLRL
jgi:hypothetical protein